MNFPGPSQDQRTRQLGPRLRVCSINVEGICRSKCECLSKLLLDKDIDVLAVQETHVDNEKQLQSRGRIPGYDLIGATYHRSYGVATYVRSNIENATLCSADILNDIHEVTVRVGEITVYNTYKPPLMSWPQHIIHPLPHPAVYVGDFNSHHKNWRYSENDANGEDLVEWSEEHSTYLVFDAKDRGTFRSAAWKREYNPDLCFVSTDANKIPLQATRIVLDDFPHSQHRPVLVEIGLSIPLVTSYPRPRWNFNKANWESFSTNLDNCLKRIPPIVKNYDRFVGAVINAAKKSIPRGYRKEYIPGWNERSEELYREFLESGDREIANELLHSLDAARQQKWSETVENLDFTKSSRKAWALLRKLGSSSQKPCSKSLTTPNAIATNIVTTSRAPRDRKHTIEIKRQLKQLKNSCADETSFSRPFTEEEISAAVTHMKTGKAPGFDGIHSELILNCGGNTRCWLACFFTNMLQTGNIPQSLKRAKIVAVLKPGKPSDNPQSYRPIALLSTIYKLLERLIHNRISSTILECIPAEQAGFRPERSCTDQVLSLTTHIEAGYQKQLKTSVVFIDLTAAYDTVWRHGLIYKLAKVVPCRKTVDLVDEMLRNRLFQVTMGNTKSKYMKLNNGLPQGSVLSPLLFSLYISDMPATTAKKFGYADDWAMAVARGSFEETEAILTADLASLGEYFRKWRLQPSTTKTEVSCFHLNNKMANRELSIPFEGHLLRHNMTPKYLGVTLDRTLSFNKHLSQSAAKINTRNNIIHKLCGTTWGSSASTLRSSALGLVYSCAEYCAPVWLNSTHSNRVDVQLNNTMRIISGTIKSTPTHWLPTLSHIPPPHLRRQKALVREYQKIEKNPQLPIHEDFDALEINRLRSRRPPIPLAKSLLENGFNINERWEREWITRAPDNCYDPTKVTQKPPGFDLPRRTWTALNRIRTNHGRCADSMYKWGRVPSPECDCGTGNQSIRHIVEACPSRSYPGPLTDFMDATQKAVEYVRNLDVCL